jgi:CheY-like chemotaxis protein
MGHAKLLRALIVGISASARAAEALIEHGFESEQAQDGVEALQMASSQGVDLILTGVDMPRMGGLELISLIGRGMFGMTPPPVILCCAGLDCARLRDAVGSHKWVGVLEIPFVTGRLADALSAAFQADADLE